MSRANKRACRTHKVRFRDGAEARRAIRRIARHPGNKLPIRAYFCPFCRGYHLTSQQQKTS